MDNLRRMADEIRVKIHLAGMDAKDTWAKLEPKLHELERKAERVKDKVADDFEQFGDDLKEQMSRLLDRIKGN
jgi:archaellum component FlaC